MNESGKSRNLSFNYTEFISRNIGLVSVEQQQEIKNSTIAIFGVGGLGGSLAEQLVRSGCENINICDNEVYDLSNLNRQLAKTKDLGKKKVDFIKDLLLDINPNVNVLSLYEITKENVNEFLKNVNIAALTLDDPLTSILISRICREKEVNLIESFGMPVLWAWWFTKDNVDYETCYNLGTKNLSYNELRNKNDLKSHFYSSILTKILKIPNLEEYYRREKEIFNRMVNQSHPLISMAPFVRMTASYLCFEILFSGLLKLKEMIKSPIIKGYDYFKMEKVCMSL
jgi:hypothetical protein